LTDQINHGIDDYMSETGSYVSSGFDTHTRISSADPSNPRKRLRLHRSRSHKLQIDITNVSADFIIFPPDSHETQFMLDLRVEDFEIIDNVPTSTWRKFVTYMNDAGRRETGSSMAHIELLNVRPVLELAASELVIRVCPLSAKI